MRCPLSSLQMSGAGSQRGHVVNTGLHFQQLSSPEPKLAGRKLQVDFAMATQRAFVSHLGGVKDLRVVLVQSSPILKESRPPAVLLTIMAEKSRSTQVVSIFYESSWVLPRGCPCLSHLKQDTTQTFTLQLFT